MAIRIMMLAGGAALLAGLALSASAADNPLEGDLRDLRVGMTVAELPAEGYTGFACGRDGAKPGPALGGWAEFARCPADPNGLHEVAFAFAPSPLAPLGDRWEGTKVAGHPVIPSLLIDDRGVVQGLRIVTDPEARYYQRKAAYLFGIRVMGRYGRDGWQCIEAKPGEGKAPIGGMFINRRCEKIFHDRRLILDTELYRAAGQEGQEYTDEARFEIYERAG
ncbi:MAG TPA: hypothetical protein VHQ91_09345 [Geminicoccaceae bacterium]|jgi:hypothetical protein|nr:hypothetical protein [Geminicoccaceae bacterium]